MRNCFVAFWLLALLFFQTVAAGAAASDVIDPQPPTSSGRKDSLANDEEQECRADGGDPSGVSEDVCGGEPKSDSNGSSSEDKGEIRNPFEFFGAFKRLGTSWKSVLDEYIETIRSAGGNDRDSDVYAENLDLAVVALRDMVDREKNLSGDDEIDGKSEAGMWEFKSVPLVEFGRTADDLLLAFLQWSAVEGAGWEECGLKGGINRQDAKAGRINVSKAFRRIRAYAAWMDAVESDLTDPPLTASSVKGAWDAFQMHITRDGCGRIVWWMDLGRADMAAIKNLPPNDILRLFVWVSHLIMLGDEGGGVENGTVFIDNMSHMSFWDYMTMLPLQLGMKLDNFMISCTPLQTKLVVFMNKPLWAEIGYNILSVFLTKEMKSRVDMVHGDRQSAVLNVVGECCIPDGFDDLEGKAEVEDIAELRFQKG